MFVKDVMVNPTKLLYEDDTILSASKYMKEERVRNLPVVNRGTNKLIGLITLREIIEIVFHDPSKILVKDTMIKQVESVTEDVHLNKAVSVMISNKYGCLPVVDKGNRLIGMITEADLLKTLNEILEKKNIHVVS